MNNLIKYLLILIVVCVPLIHAQKSEKIRQENKSWIKDSISEIEVPYNPDEEILQDQTFVNSRVEDNDSTISEIMKWKFRKHIILGN